MLILIAAASVCDAAVERVIATQPTIVEYCERCGDKAPGLPHVADAPPLDLESTYVKTSDVRYENLALLAGCATDVAVPTLKVLDETPTGVLIVPDTARVQTIVAEPSFVAPHGPAFVVVEHDAPPWLFAFVAGGACVVGGSAIFTLAGRRRRRRAHVPRATDLG